MSKNAHPHYLTRILRAIRELNRAVLNGMLDLTQYAVRIRTLLSGVDAAHLPIACNEAKFYMGA